MTRIEEAKKLREQGLSVKKIAKKMGIQSNTVSCYLWTPRHTTYDAGKRWRRKMRQQKKHQIIRKELSTHELPLEWENEVFQMLQRYYEVRKPHGRPFKSDIQSIIHLLCRRYKFPTPRKLVEATYQGGGARRLTSGYMDVLRLLDGVSPAKPIDYIKKFIDAEKLPKQEIEEAENLLKKIPFVHLQSRNPRVLAATILYVMHRDGNPTNKPILTQDYLARYFKITEVAIRNSWRQFFRNK